MLFHRTINCLMFQQFHFVSQNYKFNMTRESAPAVNAKIMLSLYMRLRYIESWSYSYSYSLS